MCNAAADCSILFKFGVKFEHAMRDAKVRNQQVTKQGHSESLLNYL